MPYNNFTKLREGKKVFCMESLDTGKVYCYKSKQARSEGQRIHEMFKHTPKSKIRIANK